MEIRLHPDAVTELEDALDYYAAIEPKLALGLLQEWETALGRIYRTPDAWTLAGKTHRRCLMSRFPYAVVFRVREDIVEIIAFMHLKRKPGYWLDRS